MRIHLLILLLLAFINGCNTDIKDSNPLKILKAQSLNQKDSLDNFVYSCTRPQPYFSQLVQPLIKENDSAWQVINDNFKTTYAAYTKPLSRW